MMNSIAECPKGEGVVVAGAAAAHEDLREKAKCAANAWQSAEDVQQEQQCALMHTSQEMMGASALVMLLSSVAVKGAHEAAIADPSAKRCTRVTFMVLHMMHAGWSTVPANAEAAALMISRLSAGKGVPAKKVPSVKLGEKFGGGDHCMVYSYQMLKRGLYQKGLRSTEGVVLSPGMIFTLKVWTTNVAKVFKDQTEDAQPFDIAVVQLMLRSNECSKTDEMLDLKSMSVMHGMSPSGLKLANSMLFPGSMQEAAIMRSRFADGTHIPPEDRDSPLLASSLKQDWLKGNLAQTVSAIRVKLPLGSGAFAIGPDDLLRFHIEVVGGLGGLSCNSLVVRYDPRQFEGAPREWIVALFNVALMMDDGAVELLISIDTYQGNANAPPVIAFARVRIAALTSTLLQRISMMIKQEEMPKAIAAVFVDPKQRKHTALFAFADDKVHLAIDTRRISRLESGASGGSSSPQLPTFSMVHMESAWQKGYNGYVFVEGRLVFHFVATADSAAASGLTAARGLQTIAMPIMPRDIFALLGNEEDEEVEEEEQQYHEEEGTVLMQQSEEAPEPEAGAAPVVDTIIGTSNEEEAVETSAVGGGIIMMAADEDDAAKTVKKRSGSSSAAVTNKRNKRQQPDGGAVTDDSAQ